MHRLWLFGGMVASVGGAVIAAQGCASVSCNDSETCPPSNQADGSSDVHVSDHAMMDVPADKSGKDGGESESSTMDGPTEGETAPTCDLTQAPSKDNCVLQDGNGFFVAPAPYGNDTTGMGTIEAPYATISKAVSQIGAATTHRIYVCDGTYNDQITVTTPIAIFGALSCGLADGGADGGSGKWAYATGTQAVVKGTSADFVLEVNTVTGVVDFVDMDFEALDASTAGQSSIAAFVISSPTVSMLRTALAGGTGVTGASGVVGGTGTPSGPLTGNNATATDPGGTCSITCSTGGVSTGGTGGTVALSGNGAPGTVAQSTPTPAGATGAGGTESACSSTTPTGGVNGSDAFPTVAADGSGAPAGTLDAAGWHPGSGQVGVNGGPGQGGGGGGSVVAGWGGGGGCGGCGGIGGGFGVGGGASIALLAYSSPVNLASCTLTTSAAGNGGTGAAGGPGETGGAHGLPSGTACLGGNGGTGSQGGGGGGGAGGISVGVLYSGAASAPVVTSGTITPGGAGSVGTGGEPGVNDGSAGVSAMTQDATKL